MKIAFATENIQKSNFDYPKLYLDQNEKARVVVIEPEPELGFEHTLKAPVIMNGQAIMETVQGKNGPYEVPKTDFLARALCMGNPNTLLTKDKDVDNCPMCAAANQSDHVAIAKRRYATNVVKYKTQPGTYNPALIQGRVQAEILVWGFTGMVFETLVGIGSEHGDLRKKDLLLGPCTNKSFQKFEIQVGSQAAWLTSDENRNLVQELYKSERTENLEVAMGRKISRDKAEEYIDQIMMKARQAFGTGSGDAVGSGVSGKQEAADSLDLDAMLNGVSGGSESAPEAVSDAPSAPVDPWTGESSAVAEEPQSEPETVPSNSATADFDDFLKDL